MRNELKGDIKGVDEKLDSLRSDLKSEIQGIKDSLNIAQRLAIIEAKLRDQEKKGEVGRS